MRTLQISILALPLLGIAQAHVNAQGIAVIDRTAILRWANQLQAMRQQFDALNKQIEQAEQLHGSLNKITDMGDVASLLNRPEIRNALPDNFASVNQLLQGGASGQLGEKAANNSADNSLYQTPAEDFYSQELTRVQKRNAGQISLGEQIYDIATKRMDGLEQLRKQISSASQAKDIADLQARIQTETAFLQTDFLRMQGLQMIQQAQLQVEDQRKAEDWRRRIDAMNSALTK